MLKTKEENYLKFYIDSNGSIDSINKFIKQEKITLNEFNDIVTGYLKELKIESDKNNSVNKLYLEYTLKYGKKEFNNKKTSKRKDTERIINIINNYIKEDKHNIKLYVENNELDYDYFIKFINNYKNNYLKDHEKEILKRFLKRENDFNKNNLEKVKNIVDKISDDLVNDKPFDILDYYKELGWEANLLIYYLNNNKELFSNFLIDNVKIYLNKYHINDKKYKLNEFIELIKEKDNISNENIENIINYMNLNKLPYNYCLFKSIKEKNIFLSE
ncbi:MAG: hypothetical protein IJD92_02205 [Bacilli bacterium]|nr:hypothetical protein [Bacilli bacterium]